MRSLLFIAFAAALFLLYALLASCSSNAMLLGEVKIGDSFLVNKKMFFAARVDVYPAFISASGKSVFRYGDMCEINGGYRNRVEVLGMSGRDEILLVFTTNDTEQTEENRRCPSGVRFSVPLEKYRTMRDAAPPIDIPDSIFLLYPLPLWAM